MNAKTLLISLFLMTGMLLQSVAQSDSKTIGKTEQLPDSSTWILSRIGGTKAKQHTGNKVFMTLSKPEHKLSGYTSCNYIHSKLTVQDSTITISEISLGKRFCDEATTALEKTLVINLQNANSWKIEGGILHLYDKGVLILEFKNATGK